MWQDAFDSKIEFPALVEILRSAGLLDDCYVGGNSTGHLAVYNGNGRYLGFIDLQEAIFKRGCASNGMQMYDPKFGDSKLCECGHFYERHFDSYDNMDPVGCKYCSCYEFTLSVT